MALYMIERSFADQLDLTDEDVELIEEVNADEGVRWLFSFLSADRRRTYCLYEAPSADAILAAAQGQRPCREVVEVGAGTPQFPDRLQRLGRRRSRRIEEALRPRVAVAIASVEPAAAKAAALQGFRGRRSAPADFVICAAN